MFYMMHLGVTDIKPVYLLRFWKGKTSIFAFLKFYIRNLHSSVRSLKKDVPHCTSTRLLTTFYTKKRTGTIILWSSIMLSINVCAFYSIGWISWRLESQSQHLRMANSSEKPTHIGLSEKWQRVWIAATDWQTTTCFPFFLSIMVHIHRKWKRFTGACVHLTSCTVW